MRIEVQLGKLFRNTNGLIQSQLMLMGIFPLFTMDFGSGPGLMASFWQCGWSHFHSTKMHQISLKLCTIKAYWGMNKQTNQTAPPIKGRVHIISAINISPSTDQQS